MDINRKNMDSLFKGFNTQFMAAFGSAPDTWQKFAFIVPSASASVIYPFLEKFGGMQEWIGDRQIKNLASKKMEVVNRDFEDTVSVKRNDIEDDQYGLYGSLIAQMGYNGAKLWQELAIAALLGNPAWIDGGDFFSSTRKFGENTIVNGSTNALTAPNYATARQTMLQYKGHNGKPLGVLPDLLIVGPALEGMAFSIVKDRVQAKAGATTDVAGDNPWMGTADYAVVPEITGNEWFLSSTKGVVKPVAVQQRKQPVLTRMDNDTDENVFKRNEYLYGTDARGEAFLAFPHLIYKGGMQSVRGLKGESKKGDSTKDDSKKGEGA